MMDPIERVGDPADADDSDDADLQAFEAMRQELEAEGIRQDTPAHLPGLIELFRRAGLLQVESNPLSAELPSATDDA